MRAFPHFLLPTPHSRLSTGFTLIEVLAALAILAIAFAVLLQAMGASLHLTANADARTRAALWAQSKLDSSFVVTPPHVGVTSGKFDSRYRWQLDVSAWQPPLPATAVAPTQDTRTDSTLNSGMHLYRLDLAVSWGQRQRTRTAHFVTLRASNAADDETGDTP